MLEAAVLGGRKHPARRLQLGDAPSGLSAADQLDVSRLQDRVLGPLLGDIDPERAKELAALWARVNMPAPLEVVDAPDRNLLATTQATIAELVRPDTEVTVLVPRRRYVGFWRRVLHDQTSAELTELTERQPPSRLRSNIP